MRILVTGSDGLIGGEAVGYFDSKGHTIIGADNNMRKEFFGPAGDTLWNRNRIFHNSTNYFPTDTDISSTTQVWSLFKTHGPFDAVIHCAAQPSHDKSRDIPVLDFTVNAVGTLNLLEHTRQMSPHAVFVFMSTNKVYGDAPNEIPLLESETRYDYADPKDYDGIDETMRIDRSTHSIFGVSKAAADLMVQEYGRYFGMKTCVLRGGCLTGPGHSGVELHGFLSHLSRMAITGGHYKVFGYKGKQVRDNIHSNDVVRAMEQVILNPRPGEVYNMGGGRENSVSIMEAIAKVESLSGRKLSWEYVDTNRVGDHICYISNLAKFKSHYPTWGITKSLDDTLADIFRVEYWGRYADHQDTMDYQLSDDSTIMDVGGYRGAFTASILERQSTKPRVFIFEPVQEFYEACKYRFNDTPNVNIKQYGLSDSDSTVILAKQGMNTSAFRGGNGQESLTYDVVYGYAIPETVKLRDIVSFLDEESVDEVELMSINAEGGEFEILRRLIDTGYIRRFRNVQVQFHSFHPNAITLREQLRKELRKTHMERFNYPFVWESWQRIEIRAGTGPTTLKREES